MIDVFISYKREDLSDARAIAETLAADGYQVWWDVRLLPGDRFRGEIEAVLRKAKVVIVLWSEQALSSAFVVDEAKLANDLGKYIPMSLDGCMPPLGFREVHCPSLAQWRTTRDSAELRTLRAAIRFRAGEPSRRASFIAQNLNQTMEANLWKTMAEMESRSPEQETESLDLYLAKFGSEGLFSDLARRLKADPSGRRRHQGADETAPDRWKRPLNKNRILSTEDLVSTKISIPKGAEVAGATWSPDASHLIIGFKEAYKGTIDRLGDAFNGKNLDYRYLHEYRLTDGSYVGRFGRFENGVAAIGLSPDGTRLAIVESMNKQCLVMNMATKSTTRVGTGIQDSAIRWSADSKRCLFEFEWSYRNVKRKVLLRPDGSVKEVDGLNALHECVIRDSWLAVARDAVVEVDRDLAGHPSEIFVLDRTSSDNKRTKLAVSPLGGYVAVLQEYESQLWRISIYDSVQWSRLGFWEVKRKYAFDAHWLSERAILTDSSSISEYEIRTVPELQLTHSLELMGVDIAILPVAKAGPAYGVFKRTDSIQVTTLGQFR